MKRTDLIRELRRLDDLGVWLFSRQDFLTLFPKDDPATQANDLARHCRNLDLVHVCRGLYANPWPRTVCTQPLERIAARLRPGHINYVSAESILSARGIISQMQQGHLTVMTTGRSGRVEVQINETARGVIEFIHTKRDPSTFMDDLTWSKDGNIYRANASRAWTDLKRIGRCTDLVDFEELEEAIQEDTEEAINLEMAR